MHQNMTIMKEILVSLMFFGLTTAKCQIANDEKIEKFAAEIASFFEKDGKIKIGLGSFSYTEKQTKLTQLIYDDLSSNLVSLNINKSKILIVSEAILNTINGYMEAETEADKALLFGKEKNAEYLIFGRISDHDSGYKIQVRLYETKEGNLVSAFKTVINKTEYLEELNAQNVGSKTTDLTLVQPVASQEPVKVKKEKVKREGKFWKFLGETAMTTGIQVVNNTIEKKLSKSGTSSDTSSQSQTGDQGNTGTQTEPQSGAGTDCKVYVNIVNKTENVISVKVYKENPSQSFGVRVIYSFTIAAGKSKKQRMEKDVLYYYHASNNTGGPVIGSYREYEGTFEAENCNETVDEEIE